MKTITKLWIGIGLLIVFSPLGLILPARFKSGSAWGEWGTGEIKRFLGYVPKGMEKLSGIWSAPMPDYAFRNWGGENSAHLSFAYTISAIIGIGLTAILAMLIGKKLTKKGK